MVTGAGRAIHDLPLEEDYPALAKCLERYATHPSPDAVPLLRRAVHAHFLLGHADALAKFAATKSAPPPMPVEALAPPAAWGSPSPRHPAAGFLWPPP